MKKLLAIFVAFLIISTPVYGAVTSGTVNVDTAIHPGQVGYVDVGFDTRNYTASTVGTDTVTTYPITKTVMYISGNTRQTTTTITTGYTTTTAYTKVKTPDSGTHSTFSFDCYGTIVEAIYKTDAGSGITSCTMTDRFGTDILTTNLKGISANTLTTVTPTTAIPVAGNYTVDITGATTATGRLVLYIKQ